MLLLGYDEDGSSVWFHERFQDDCYCGGIADAVDDVGTYDHVET